jgi:cytochrome c
MLLLALAGFGRCVGAGHAADAAYGEYLAAECAACHREETANLAIPPLQGLSYDRLVAALEEYRNGTRRSEIMRSVARSLSDVEIEALADYFSRRS